MSVTSADLLLSLQVRLKAAEHRLQNDAAHDTSTAAALIHTSSVLSRLSRLQSKLAELTLNDSAAAGLLQLHASHPELFKQKDENEPDTKQQLPMLISSAASFPTTVSYLNDLQDYLVPDPKVLASLLALQPRLARAQAVQEAQEDEVSKLRQRSAAVMTLWHSQTVLEGGERWSEWEDRMMKMEQKIRREGAALRREEYQSF